MSAGWNMPACQVAMWSRESSTAWSRAKFIATLVPQTARGDLEAISRAVSRTPATRDAWSSYTCCTRPTSYARCALIRRPV